MPFHDPIFHAFPPDPPEVRAWMARANCRGMSTSLFFPDGSGHDAVKAKRVCAKCEVQPDCLEYALALNISHGTWGGATERGRRALKRERRMRAREGVVA